MSENTTFKSTPSRWYVLALLMCFAAVNHFNRTSIAVAGTEYFIKNGLLSEKQMGAAYTTYLILYTLLMIPCGWLIDRYRPRKAFLLLGIGSAVTVPMTVLAVVNPIFGVFGTLLVVRGLMGIFCAPLHPGAARAVSIWLRPPEHGFGNGMVTAAALIGISATPLVFGFLMDMIKLPGALITSGVVSLVLTLIWWFTTPDRPPNARDDDPKSQKQRDLDDVRPPAWTDEDEVDEPKSVDRTILHLLLLTAGYAAYSYFQYLFFYWVQYLFDTILQLGKDKGRLYTTYANLSMAAGMLCGGLLLDVLRRIWPGWLGTCLPPLVGMVVSAVLMIIGISSTNEYVVVTFLCASMAALGVCEAPFWIVGVGLGGRRGGFSASVLNAGGNAGGLIAPIITPYISDVLGWKGGFIFAAVVCGIGAGFWLFVPAPKPDDDSAPSTT